MLPSVLVILVVLGAFSKVSVSSPGILVTCEVTGCSVEVAGSSKLI